MSVFDYSKKSIDDRYSQRTLALLMAAGWYEGRTIDIAEFRGWLALAGYELHPKASEFLEQYGAIRVQSSDLWICGEPTGFYIGVGDWVVDETHSDARCFTRILGTSVCLVGLVASDYDLIMTITGEVLASLDNSIWRVGSSGEDAVETLCTGVPWTKLK
jgi:hypothetical protein